ncbi:MAG: tetratricopeptide repeat protein [bacterium]
MESELGRAGVLLAQRRWDLAERELRGVLALEPHHAHAHALLSLCLTELDRATEATAEAEEAIRHEPDLAVAHHALAAALERRHHLVEAERAIEAAIRLDPTDASACALLGQIHAKARRWTEALAAADRGLELDPEDQGCANVRALALTQLGRRGDAAAALGDSLSRDPENAFTHANSGWACLHRNDIEGARRHFLEALRLAPDLDWARDGLLHTLKASSRVYRVLLRYFLWTSRLGRQRAWQLLIGLWIVPRVLRALAAQVPVLEPVVLPLMALYVLFAFLTWTGDHVFNVLLFFHPVGRAVLKPRERAGAVAVTACLVGGLGASGVGLARGWGTLSLAGLLLTLYVIPLSTAFRADGARERRTAFIVAGTLAVTMLVSTLLMVLAAPSTPGSQVAGILFAVYVLGVAASSWIANYAAIHGVRE